MKGIAIVRTVFGSRQNDRDGVLIWISGWLPRWRSLRLPFGNNRRALTQDEISGMQFKWGRFHGVHETGEPKWTPRYVPPWLRSTVR